MNHFIMFDYYSGFKTPVFAANEFFIFLSGIILMAASVGIILKKFIPLVCWVLSGLLLFFIIFVHIPRIFDSSLDIYQSKYALVELLKDTSLMGGSLLIAVIHAKKTVS